MEKKLNKKILNLAARLRYLAKARVSATECLREIKCAIEGTSADLQMDFGDYERKLLGLITGYLNDVEKYLKKEFKL